MKGSAGRFEVYTLGCKVNFAESSARARALEEAGWARVLRSPAPSGGSHPDLIIVNTCSVTAAADKKCRNLIARLHRQHPDAEIVATGCYATRAPQEVGALPGVARVESNLEKPLCVASLGDRTRSFLKVQDGCDYACSYCTIRSARGPSRNPSIAEVVEQARRLASAGVREVVLTGVNTGDFGRSTGETFIDLLRALDALGSDTRSLAPADAFCSPFASAIRHHSRGEGRTKAISEGPKGEEIAFVRRSEPEQTSEQNVSAGANERSTEYIDRFRISSIEPNLLTDEVIDFCAASPRWMSHFHIPLQSGCDRILSLMRRRYTAARFAERVARVRAVMPDAFFGIDVIVGFPGETDDDFEQTYRFLERLRPAELHVFPYSVRPGTPAAEMPDRVPPQKIAARARRLALLSEGLHAGFRSKFLSPDARVLWENTDKKSRTMSGFTENYIKIEAPHDASKIGTVTPL